ncbi:MAG: hypothetical protein WB822_10570, partial [Rhodoplanes sp.]
MVRSRPTAVGGSAQVLILPAFFSRYIAGCERTFQGQILAVEAGHASAQAGVLRVIREASAVTEKATEFKYRAFIAFS